MNNHDETMTPDLWNLLPEDERTVLIDRAKALKNKVQEYDSPENQKMRELEKALKDALDEAEAFAKKYSLSFSLESGKSEYNGYDWYNPNKMLGGYFSPYGGDNGTGGWQNSSWNC